MSSDRQIEDWVRCDMCGGKGTTLSGWQSETGGQRLRCPKCLGKRFILRPDLRNERVRRRMNDRLERLLGDIDLSGDEAIEDKVKEPHDEEPPRPDEDQRRREESAPQPSKIQRWGRDRRRRQRSLGKRSRPPSLRREEPQAERVPNEEDRIAEERQPGREPESSGAPTDERTGQRASETGSPCAMSAEPAQESWEVRSPSEPFVQSSVNADADMRETGGSRPDDSTVATRPTERWARRLWGTWKALHKNSE